MQALEARPLTLGRAGQLRRPGPQRVSNPRKPRLCCGSRRLSVFAMADAQPPRQVWTPRPGQHLVLLSDAA